MNRFLSLCLTAGLMLTGRAIAATSIYDVIKRGKDFKTFGRLIDACPQVREVLESSPGPFTLLVPTDAAYARLDAKTRSQVTDAKNAESLLLTQLLSGRWTVSGLAKNDGKHVMTYTQLGVQIRKGPSGVTVAGISLLGKPIDASNGAVFAVDRPIVVPPGMKLSLPARKNPPAEENFVAIPIAPGKRAPEFRLVTLAGKPVTLADALRGRRATLLYFWFAECAPCRASIPDVNHLYRTLREKGLGFLAINTADGAAIADRFAKENGLEFPIALNGSGPNDVRQSYFAEGTPAYVLIGRDGLVVDSFIGSDKPRLLRALEKAGIPTG